MLSRFDIPDPGRRVKSAILAELVKLGRFGRRVRGSTGLDIVAADGIPGLTAPALTRRFPGATLPGLEIAATLPGLVIPRPHSSAMKLSRRRLALL